MGNCNPLVSIVTPVYNGSKYVEELIKSVLDQDYSPIEHIIIDDGSNDNGATVEILKRYPHLRWWTRPNKGAYATINEGLAASIGQLVTVISSDDKYAGPAALSSAVELFNAEPHCDAVFGETITIGADGRMVDKEGPRSGPLWLFRYYAVVAHCSLVVKREKIVSQRLWFDESFPYDADRLWIMDMISAGYKFQRLRCPIAMYRQHPFQRGNHVSPARAEEIWRIEQRHGRGNPLTQYMVNKWAMLTKFKNCLLRKGCAGTLTEIRGRYKWFDKA